jgi:hypothetical protein
MNNRQIVSTALNRYAEQNCSELNEKDLKIKKRTNCQALKKIKKKIKSKRKNQRQNRKNGRG